MSASPVLSPVYELVIHMPGGHVRSVPLEGDRIGLGRSNMNQLCYPEDGGLSRQHLVFERTPAGWQVRDLGSKNGTLVNGNRILEAHLLSPGDRIAAGHLLLEYAGSHTAEPAPKTVVFVEGPAVPPAGTTLIAKLEGILSDKEDLDGGPQMRALIRAGRELAGHRPLSDLFQLIMDLSIEAVGASRGVLMTLENGQLLVRAAKGEGFRISTAVRDKVIAERASMLVRDARLDEALAGRLSIVEQQVRSILAVPLQTDKAVLGLIYVDSPHFVHEFSKADLNLLTVMSNVAAIRIEHARLAEVEQAERLLAKELDQAAEIQRGLLPKEPPAVEGLELAGYNAACRTVGGDYYDFLSFPDGRIGLLIADVAGKGMPAALLMSSLQARVQVLTDDPSDAAGLVTRLNRALTKYVPSNRFVTLFLGIYNPKTSELTYVNAGHNPPLLARPDGTVEELEVTGLILGIRAGASYEQKTCKLGSGDVLLLFSDGVTEAASHSEELFGEERLKQVLAGNRQGTAQQLIAAVNRAVAAWMGPMPAGDDITLVVARRV